jgi:hypothetical protein
VTGELLAWMSDLKCPGIGKPTADLFQLLGTGKDSSYREYTCSSDLERLRVTAVITVKRDVYTSGKALLELTLKPEGDPVCFLQRLLALRVVGVMVVKEVWDVESVEGYWRWSVKGWRKHGYIGGYIGGYIVNVARVVVIHDGKVKEVKVVL